MDTLALGQVFLCVLGSPPRYLMLNRPSQSVITRGRVRVDSCVAEKLDKTLHVTHLERAFLSVITYEYVC